MLGNTLLLVASVTAIVLPAGTIVAWACTWLEWPGRRRVLQIGLAVLFFPVLLQAAAWDAALGRQGLLGPQLGMGGIPVLQGWTGAILLHAVVALPWAAWIIGLGLRDLEPELVEQAWLDGGPWSALWRVAAPRCRGTLALAAAWTVVMVASDMTITDMYQVRTCAEVLYADFALEDEPLAVIAGAAPSILTIAALLALLLGCAWTWRPLRALSPRAVPPRRIAGGWLLSLVMLFGAALLVGVPLASLVLKAGTVATPAGDGWERHWSARHAVEMVVTTPHAFRDEFWWTTVLAVGAAMITTLLAAPWAWWARRSPARMAASLAALALLASVPGPLLAVAIAALRTSSGGEWLDVAAERTVLIPWLYLALRAAPLATALIWYSLRTLPEGLFESLTLDGVGTIEQLWRVVLPLRWRAAAAAWIIAAGLSAGELAGTILLIPGRVSTVAVRMFQLLHAGVDDRLAGLCLTSAIGYAVAALAAWSLAKRAGGSE